MSSTPDEVPKRCHTCVSNGFKLATFWMTPEKKSQVKQYCKTKGITMSALMLQLINDRLASDQLDFPES